MALYGPGLLFDLGLCFMYFEWHVFFVFRICVDVVRLYFGGGFYVYVGERVRFT